jgi:hypothetical protein
MAITKNSQIDLNGNEMILDADGDTTITADTDDQIDIKVAGSDKVQINATGLGIGQVPTRDLSLHAGDASSVFAHFTNTDTGTTSSDGLLIGLGSSEDLVINNQESSKNIIIENGGSERMRIDASGNVGIGETSPLGKLHIKEDDSGASSVNANFDQLVLEDDSHSGMTILSGTSGDGGIYFGDSGSNEVGQIKYRHSTNALDFSTNGVNNLRLESTAKLTVDPAGSFADDNAGILQLRVNSSAGGWAISARSAVTTSTGYWFVGKQSNATNVFTLTSDSNSIDLNFLSDERMKMNITDSADVLDKVKQITVKDFDWRTELNGDTKDDSRPTKEYGFIAQNFQDIGLGQYVKELMPTDESDDTLGMDYGNITPILVKAIQEQQTIIEDLKARIATLEGS